MDLSKTHLNALVEQQVRQHLDVSQEEFEYLTHPSPNHLHDPFYYKDMRELVMLLHGFKQKQEKDPSLLLIVDGDYDTDGICATAILTGALSVFGFQFRVYVPSMEDGYGLSPVAVDKMRSQYEKDGYRIGMILTADNGISAFSGINYANTLKIDVLVTDHHPAKEKLPAAKAIVDPNRLDDLYPFKGNSGGCVAWKTMLAYAGMYQKDAKLLIERLIVFAGISNVGDIMPIRNENRYTVTAALSIIKDLINKTNYKDIADTPYRDYNTLFYGLYDLITLLQKSKDEKRAKKRKQPVPLPMNEELFSWYLAPLLNAPRRVHDTCLEGMAAFLVPDEAVRKKVIERLIELNEEKSKLRDRVMEKLEPGLSHIVICANTRKGISGLIAGKLSEQSRMPSIVFSRFDPEDETVIYTEVPNDGILTGSARSNAAIPLDRIMDKMNQIQPGILSGGGHSTAAGFSIKAKDYPRFREILAKILPEVYQETLLECGVVAVPENTITIYATKSIPLTAEFQISIDGEIETENTELDTKTFSADAKDTISFLESLRPFGEGFCSETKFELVFDNSIYTMEWDPDFWKTFKFSLYGVEVLTFDIEWAKTVKTELEKGETVRAVGKLRLNEFRGKVTPQMVIKAK